MLGIHLIQEPKNYCIQPNQEYTTTNHYQHYLFQPYMP